MNYPFSPDVRALNPGLADASASTESKYHNKRVLADGLSFDSGEELADYRRLQLEVKAGEHIAVFHHIRFPLQAGIVYEADFVTLEFDGTWEVWDSKGMQTKDFKLKRKLFREKYGKDIKLL